MWILQYVFPWWTEEQKKLLCRLLSQPLCQPDSEQQMRSSIQLVSPRPYTVRETTSHGPVIVLSVPLGGKIGLFPLATKRPVANKRLSLPARRFFFCGPGRKQAGLKGHIFLKQKAKAPYLKKIDDGGGKIYGLSTQEWALPLMYIVGLNGGFWFGNSECSRQDLHTILKVTYCSHRIPTGLQKCRHTDGYIWCWIWIKKKKHSKHSTWTRCCFFVVISKQDFDPMTELNVVFRVFSNWQLICYVREINWSTCFNSRYVWSPSDPIVYGLCPDTVHASH